MDVSAFEMIKRWLPNKNGRIEDIKIPIIFINSITDSLIFIVQQVTITIWRIMCVAPSFRDVLVEETTLTLIDSPPIIA